MEKGKCSEVREDMAALEKDDENQEVYGFY